MQLFEYLAKTTLVLLMLACPITSISAAELLVIEQPDCPFCERFNEEIGHAYANTDEGKLAPLVRLQLYENWPEEYSKIAKAKFTPTFILVHEGIEIDRLHGYQGDEFFWFLLGDMLEKLPQ